MPSMFPRTSSSQTQPRATPTLHQVLPFLSDSALSILGPVVCRALVDTVYETKKKGAKEIEDVISFIQDREIGVAREQKTSAIVNVLVEEFLASQNKEMRTGGLLGILGVARGLKDNSKYYLAQMVIPVIASFHDTVNPTLRYYTAECIYNLCLIAPVDVVVFLVDLIEILSKLYLDAEAVLLRAAQILDPTLRELAKSYATPSQFTSVAETLLQMCSTGPAKAPLYVIPWFELLSEKAATFTVASTDVIEALIGLNKYRLNTQQTESVNDCIDKWVDVILLRQNSEGEAWSDKLQPILINMVETQTSQTQGSVISLLLALAGLRQQREQIFTTDVISEEMQVNILQLIVNGHADFFVSVSLTLLNAGISYEGIVTSLNERIRLTLIETEETEAQCERIANFIAHFLAMPRAPSRHGFAALEIALEWLCALSDSKYDKGLPDSVLPSVVTLISSEHHTIRKLAIQCLSSVCTEGPMRRATIFSTLQKLAEVRTTSQASYLLDLITQLIIIEGHETCLGSFASALKTLDPQSPRQLAEASMAALLVVSRLMKCNLRWSVKDAACLDTYPLIHFLMCAAAYDCQDASTLDIPVYLRWADEVYGCIEWPILEVEILVDMLEIPTFALFRVLPLSRRIYEDAAMILPLTSPMHRIAESRRKFRADVMSSSRDTGLLESYSLPGWVSKRVSNASDFPYHLVTILFHLIEFQVQSPLHELRKSREESSKSIQWKPVPGMSSSTEVVCQQNLEKPQSQIPTESPSDNVSDEQPATARDEMSTLVEPARSLLPRDLSSEKITDHSVDEQKDTSGTSTEANSPNTQI